ncbi:NAD(P)-dependent alcohol dehydrogenase [Pelagibacterium sp.]|uniref:NAD(P)-dependent alcohol dehydrogenase n=1 Tax=Pelagibacterium sp. TaxID=1967288 RepID=UPI003BAA5844
MTIPTTMKAAIVTAYGGPQVVEIQSRPTPIPRDDQVLVKTIATTVNSGDARMRALDAPAGMKTLMRLAIGITRPRQPIFGTEIAGTIVAIGPKVSRFSIGDHVIAFPDTGLKCHAQYVAVSERKSIVPKPENLSFDEAAGLCFGGTAALHFLRKAGIKPGEHVLVIGASGAVGSAMVQLAGHFGATVTAVASAANADLARGLGANAFIDYAITDYTAVSSAYDVIADTVGATDFRRCLNALKPGGRYLGIAGGIGDMLARPKNGKRPIAGMAAQRPEDVAFLAGLAAKGAYRVVVDQTFAFADITSAHARVDSKHKRGSVVVRVDDWSASSKSMSST